MSTVAHQIEPRLDHEVDIEGLDEARALSKRGDTICFRVGEAERLAEATVKLLEDVGDAVGPALGTARAVVTYLEGMWSEIERVIMDVRIHARKVAAGNGKTAEATRDPVNTPPAANDESGANGHANRATEKPEPASDGKRSIFEDPYFALPRIRETIECCCARLKACRVFFEAETPDGLDLPFEQGNAIDSVIFDVRNQLENDCVETIARICRTRDRWLDRDAMEHIDVNRELTRDQVFALTGIVRVLAPLPGEELEKLYHNMDTLLPGLSSGAKPAHAEAADPNGSTP